MKQNINSITRQHQTKEVEPEYRPQLQYKGSTYQYQVKVKLHYLSSTNLKFILTSLSRLCFWSSFMPLYIQPFMHWWSSRR